MKKLVCIILAVIGYVAPTMAVTQPTPVWTANGETFSPIDIEEVNATMRIDVVAKTLTVEAFVSYRILEDGNPYFRLQPQVESLEVDGIELSNSSFGKVHPARDAAHLFIVRDVQEKDSRHLLKISYALKSDRAVGFNSGGFQLFFDMSDVDDYKGSHYLERYLPANFEFDQFSVKLEILAKGLTKYHTLFTNADVIVEKANQWKLAFPNYFTSSSHYLHLSSSAFVSRTVNFDTGERIIPVTLYKKKGMLSFSSISDSEMKSALTTLSENTETFGPFPHKKMLAYLTNFGGGMEFAGATITDAWAMPHEITHSWFARGVMPSNGNAGWIDEAIASWRDSGYPTGSDQPRLYAVNLAGRSPFATGTLLAAYKDGRDLIASLDAMAAPQGGMRAILRDLYMSQRRQVITTELFKSFVENAFGMDLSKLFAVRVYGKKAFQDIFEMGFDANRPLDFFSSFEIPGIETGNTTSFRHPIHRPFTHEEILQLR